MYESSILTWVENSLKFWESAYKESIFNKYFLKLDNFLKEAALNSKIVGLFIMRGNKRLSEGSRIYELVDKILSFPARMKNGLGNSVRDSKNVAIFAGLINQSFNNVYRTLGIFTASFFAANITLGLIMHKESTATLAVKLMLLIFSLIAVRIKVDFNENFKDSKFYKIFQWIIEVEK